MEARRCIVCGTNHWSTQPCPATRSQSSAGFAEVAAEERGQQIACKPVTKNPLKPFTKTPANGVTKTTPPLPKPPMVSVTPPEVSATVSVTPNKGGRPPSPNKLSRAEIQRRYRQRQKLTAASTA